MATGMFSDFRDRASRRVRVTTGLPTPSATPDVTLALLRGGGLPALVTGMVLTAGVAGAGSEAAAGAASGTVVAGAAMSIGPLVMRVTRRCSPPAVMAVALTAYGVVVIVLGGIYLLLARAVWVSSGHLAVALIAGGAVWAAGQLRATRRLRVLAFGDGGTCDDVPPTSGSAPGQAGKTGPEPPNLH
jgi:hypothetical protein